MKIRLYDYPKIESNVLELWLLENIGMGQVGSPDLADESDKWLMYYDRGITTLQFRNELDYGLFLIRWA